MSIGNGSEGRARYVRRQARKLRDWMTDKRSIVCITGAGMSTESGIPDYRGSRGSYFRGHKPIVHHEFMSSPSKRKRYWARSLVGYSPFANAEPNRGHEALARLEDAGRIGVDLGGCAAFDRLGESCFGSADGGGREGAARRISVVTQNVDDLHGRAGVRNCLHLHGRGDRVRCMNCGLSQERKEYHDRLTRWNRDWLKGATASGADGAIDNGANDGKAALRPDGDAELGNASYDELLLPPCPRCGGAATDDALQQERQSFFKTDVVFFGDSVPKHRFDVSHAAIDAADGVLVVGTSLAVHSAFRLVKRAVEDGTPVAILNVGETRAEREGLGRGGGGGETGGDGDGGRGLVTKIESPVGDTLAALVEMLDREDRSGGPRRVDAR